MDGIGYDIAQFKEVKSTLVRDHGSFLAEREPRGDDFFARMRGVVSKSIQAAPNSNVASLTRAIAEALPVEPTRLRLERGEESMLRNRCAKRQLWSGTFGVVSPIPWIIAKEWVTRPHLLQCEEPYFPH
jgi:hypothetical protein